VPGGLTFAEPALRPNEIYDIENLRLIFFDNPFWGPYKPRLARILGDPRYGNLRANLRHFAALYTVARDRRRTAAPPASPERNRFDQAYDRHIAAETAKLAALLAQLDTVRRPTLETVV
jgi:hypothetical protein